MKGMGLRRFVRQWKIDRGICNGIKGKGLLEGRLELVENARVGLLAFVWI
jgi:hypothetical protein